MTAVAVTAVAVAAVAVAGEPVVLAGVARAWLDGYTPMRFRK